MTIRIISAGIRKKPTDKSIQYATPSGSSYVRKADLKAAGCTVAPETLFFIVTDELPAGWQVEAEAQTEVSFEL